MSSEFGYIPESPEQSFGNNNGIFTPRDIYDLTRANKFTQIGQLEHIITSTASSSTIDFVDKFSDHNTFFITLTNLVPSTQAEFGIKLSNDSGSSYETSNYNFGNQRCFANGTYEEKKSNSQSSIRLGGDVETSDSFNGYIFIHNANDKNKFTHVTHNSSYTGTSGAGGFGSSFGGGVYTVQEIINGIRIGETTSVSAFTSGTASLYGFKEF
tara:strand:- start:207 stop:842 length:636 start_codon:yes stop_codon:yes gene_type:complete